MQPIEEEVRTEFSRIDKSTNKVIDNIDCSTIREELNAIVRETINEKISHIHEIMKNVIKEAKYF